MTFKNFIDSIRLIDQSQHFVMLEGEKMSIMLPKSWKKPLNNGIIIIVKLRRCDECKDKMLCMTCNNKNNENKDFKAILNILKRKAPSDFGYMLPY